MKKKILRLLVMASFYSFLTFLCQVMALNLAFASGVAAQNYVSIKEVSLSVTFDNTRLIDVFTELEAQTSYTFVYDKNDGFLKDRFNYSGLNITVEALLLEIAKQASVNFRQVNNNISVTKRSGSIKNKIEEIMQSIVVSGNVSSQSGPLPGVSILVKGTMRGTVTDENGNYQITVPEDATLVFSSIGYLTEETIVGNRTVINVVMIEDLKQLQEMVIIGYGTQKKSDLTGSIASVNAESVQKTATNDIRKALQGQVAGVTVQSGGEPGADPIVKIRGVGSLTNNTPLYLVDGIQTPISQIPTSDIESIQILKDGAAASIYGSRAANGVVIITTKRGQKGDVKIGYNTYYGIQNITHKYDVTSREDYQMLNNEAVTNAMLYDPGLTLVPSNDPGSAYFIDDIDTDWQDEARKTGTIMEHNFNLSGGDENVNYFVSLNYYNQKGTVEGNGPNYKRYSARVNTDFKPGKFSFGESFQFAREDFDFAGFIKDGNYIIDMVRAIPTMSIYDDTKVGGFGGCDNVIHRSLTSNVIGSNTILKNQSVRYRFIGNTYAQYEIINGLNFKTSLSLERSDWRDTREEPEYDLGTTFTNIIPKFFDWRGEGTTISIENTLTYSNHFGQHNVTLMIGNTALQSKVINLNSRAENVDYRYPDVISSGTDRFVDATENENRISSYFGRLLYDFDGKYLLTATVRRDGSSRFGPNYRYGVFPSVSVGWKIHQESFMQSVPMISMLKLRASHGILGNQEILNYGYTTYINPYAHAVFNGQLAPGSTQVSLSNPDLKWEEKTSSNIALDLGIFNDKLTLTTEYFISETHDLLFAKPIPASTGIYPDDVPESNAASIRNSGIEFELKYADKAGELSYSVSANVSTLKNKVLSLGGGEPIFGIISKTEVGGEVGKFYGYSIEKIIQSQEEINVLNAASPDGLYQEVNTAPGDYKFEDLDGDNNITDADRKYLGSAIPKVYFGGNFSATYKKFDFTMLLQGHAGNKIYDAIRVSVENASGYANYSTNVLDRWTTPGQDTDVPRVIIGDPNANARNSARWLQDGSYLRISTVQIGYNLSGSALSKFSVENLRVYLTAQNLLTITKYEGFDPDFGNDGLFDRGVDHADAPLKAFNAYTGGLPNPRSFIIGLQVQF